MRVSVDVGAGAHSDQATVDAAAGSDAAIDDLAAVEDAARCRRVVHAGK